MSYRLKVLNEYMRCGVDRLRVIYDKIRRGETITLGEALDIDEYWWAIGDQTHKIPTVAATSAAAKRWGRRWEIGK